MKRLFFPVSMLMLVLMTVSVRGVNLCAQLPFTVVDFRPAPGQFTDYTLFLEPGQEAATLTMEQVCEKLNTWMAELPFSYLVSLGGFGGEVTVRLNTALANEEGTDFKVYGNAFYTGAHTPESGGRLGGSAEPGVIWVSRDANGNGLPDDPWYEIAGSVYAHPETVRPYTITYYEPDTLSSSVLWRDNMGGEGYIARSSYHGQPSYYPLWAGRDSLVFTGTRLPDNAEWEDGVGGSGNGSGGGGIGSVGADGGNGGQWVLYCFDWGYADNHPNSSDLSNIDIDWAVDAAGEPAGLTSIDFVKVVSGINRQIGMIGEISTEFAGVEPLRGASAEDVVRECALSQGYIWVRPNPCRNLLRIECAPSARVPGVGGEKIRLMDKTGRLLRTIPPRADGANVEVDMSAYPAGIYLLRSGSQTVKVIKL